MTARVAEKTRPRSIVLEGVFRDELEVVLQDALGGTKSAALIEAAYLAYEGIRSGKFGDGPFSVNVVVDSNSFAVTVKGG